MKHLKAFEAKRLPKNNQVICEDDLGEISALFQEVAVVDGDYYRWGSDSNTYPYSKFYKIVIY